MNRLQILLAVKANLATGAGEPDKHRTICFAVDDDIIAKHRLRGAARTAAVDIKNEVREYLYPHLTFRSKMKAHTIDQIQAARHAYIDDLINKEESK
jgi:hypothetical protein